MHTYWTSMLWSIDSYQNRLSADQNYLTVSRAQVSTHRSQVFFFKVIRQQVTNFQMIAGSSSIFLKLIWNMSCLCAAQLNFWFQTELRRENLASYYRQRRQLHLTLHTMVMRFYHALRPIFMFWLVKIWQVSSCGKFMQHLESCLLCLLWQLRLTKFCVNLWCF